MSTSNEHKTMILAALNFAEVRTVGCVTQNLSGNILLENCIEAFPAMDVFLKDEEAENLLNYPGLKFLLGAYFKAANALHSQSGLMLLRDWPRELVREALGAIFAFMDDEVLTHDYRITIEALTEHQFSDIGVWARKVLENTEV